MLVAEEVLAAAAEGVRLRLVGLDLGSVLGSGLLLALPFLSSSN